MIAPREKLLSIRISLPGFPKAESGNQPLNGNIGRLGNFGRNQGVNSGQSGLPPFSVLILQERGGKKQTFRRNVAADGKIGPFPLQNPELGPVKKIWGSWPARLWASIPFQSLGEKTRGRFPVGTREVLRGYPKGISRGGNRGPLSIWA